MTDMGAFNFLGDKGKQEEDITAVKKAGKGSALTAGVKAAGKVTEEHKLVVQGYECPSRFVNDFAPDEFEELVNMFVKYDIDESKSIDIHEIRKLLHDMDLDHTMDTATELLELLDEDGSGQLEFSEFAEFFARIKRGDSKLRGYAKLTEALNETPLAILDMEAKKRHLVLTARIVEERKATSMHAPYFVMEVVLTGMWFDMVDGKAQMFNGPKRFQGIGKTTREAKFKAANTALEKLKSMMPGMMHDPGVIPPKWMNWLMENMLRGVSETKICSMLVNKGFVPSKNKALMHHILMSRELKKKLIRDPDFISGGHGIDIDGVVSDDLENWLDTKMRMGIDGAVLVEVLKHFNFNLEKNPILAQRLRRNEVRAGGLFRPAMIPDPLIGRARDFYTACEDGALSEVKTYILAGFPVDEVDTVPGRPHRAGLATAAANGRVRVVRLLLKAGAAPNRQDDMKRAALHYAALSNHVGTLECLLHESEADPHAQDSHHNTPLHLASKYNKLDAVNTLMSAEEEFTRLVLSEGQRVHAAYSLKKIIEMCFHHFPKVKLHPKDQPRFRKAWLFEAVLWIYDKFDMDKRRFVPQPHQLCVEFCLKRFDPDPDGGFFDGVRGEEIWIPCINTLIHMEILVEACIRQAACHTVNKLARTPLHEACFENKMDSHKEVIDAMVNNHGCNMEFKDMHGNTAYDILIVARGRPNSPSGTDLRERLITEGRDELLQARIDARDARLESERLVRQVDTLQQAMIDGTELSRDGWEMVKAVSQPEHKLPPYVCFTDPDSQNRFFVKKAVETGSDFAELEALGAVGPKDEEVEKDRKKRKAKKKKKREERDKAEAEALQRQLAMGKDAARPRREGGAVAVADGADEQSKGSDATGDDDGSGSGTMSQEDGSGSEKGVPTDTESDSDSDSDSDSSSSSSSSSDEEEEKEEEKKTEEGQPRRRGGAAARRAAEQERLERELAIMQANELSIRFNWERPDEFAIRERLKVAVESVRNRSTFIRSVGDWDLMREIRLGTTWWCHWISSEARFMTPTECKWETLTQHPDTKKIGNLGLADEWTVFEDPYGKHFYLKEITGDYRWERPPDAVERNPDGSDTQCTRIIFGPKRVKQNWYSNENLTHYLMSKDPMANRFQACQPCAKKLLRECQETLNDPDKYYSLVNCHGGLGIHTNRLKFIRTSEMICNVVKIPELEPAGAKEAAAMRELQIYTRQYNDEIIRQLIARREQPCVMACVPKTFADGRPKAIRSWHMCRRRRGSEIIFGWQAVHDPEPPDNLQAGDSVLAKKEHAFGWFSAIISRRKPNDMYDVSFSGTEVRRNVRREDIDADGPVFWWHSHSGVCQWNTPDMCKAFERDQEERERQLKAEKLGSAGRLRGRKAGTALSANQLAKLKYPTGEDGEEVEEANTGPAIDMDEEKLQVEQQKRMKEAIEYEQRVGPKVMITLRDNKRGRRGPRNAEGDDADDGSVGSQGSKGSNGGRGGRGAVQTMTLEEMKAKKQREQQAMEAAEDVSFMTRYNRKLEVKDVPWPFLTGNEWTGEYLPKVGAPRRTNLGGWDEFQDPDTGVVFYRHLQRGLEEDTAIFVQKNLRTKFNYPCIKFWDSKSFQFDKPPEVIRAEHERLGWGVIRRRSQVVRDLRDKDEGKWEERLDSVSGDTFYYMTESGKSTWDKPELPVSERHAHELDDLDEGERVRYRFEGETKESDALIAEVVFDQASNERMYHVKDENDEEKKWARWVGRTFVRRQPLNHDELLAEQEHKIWKWQLRKAREAEERKEKRKAKERALEARMARRGGRLVELPPKLSKEEIVDGSSQRGELEQQERYEKFKAAREAELAEAMQLRKNAALGKLEAPADAHLVEVRPAGDISSDDEADEEGAVKEAVPGVDPAAIAAQDEARKQLRQQREERRAQLEEQKLEAIEREKFLSAKEDHVTTPRTQRRRVVHRCLHRALWRQKEGFVICKWGCGMWVLEGQAEHYHQREQCVKRLVQCVLGCPLQQREEEWMAPATDMDKPTAAQLDEAAGSDDESTIAMSQTTDADSVTTADSNSKGGGKKEGYTVQQWHEEYLCPRRQVMCPRRCGEWIAYEDLAHHMDNLCVKRPFPPLKCRLGCGTEFAGGVHRMLQCEEERLEHEQEMCENRYCRCLWKGCSAMILAKDRQVHRDKHLIGAGIITYTVPGKYKYVVGPATHQVKVQAWGAGGGSGYLKKQIGGNGGGGAFLEVLLSVNPGETLEVTVGSAGEAGQIGKRIQTADPDDPSISHITEEIGVANGGFPGGGTGYGANQFWGAGGGGGYTMFQRMTAQGMQCLLVAGGGGGGGGRDGVPGAHFDGELPGTKYDSRNGRCGTQEYGGKAGDCGEGSLAQFDAEDGKQWTGGNGASFGGGGGGGMFGGGGGGLGPGIVGGGGGGSCYIAMDSCADVLCLQGEGYLSGGDAEKFEKPLATGLHELDKIGGHVGDGGKGDKFKTEPGRHGGVRVMRPGFYPDNEPPKKYTDPRSGEVLLKMGVPIAQTMRSVEADFEEDYGYNGQLASANSAGDGYQEADY